MSISRKLSKSNVSLKINLKDLLGDIVNDEDTRAAIGQRAIDIILERTSEGRDANGRRFKKYSKDYMKSDEFIAFGKTETPNLALSGDMLGLMTIVEESPSQITISWEDDEQLPKAYNHITGDTVPQRDFFNLNKKETEQLKRFAKDLIDNE